MPDENLENQLFSIEPEPEEDTLEDFDDDDLDEENLTSEDVISPPTPDQSVVSETAVTNLFLIEPEQETDEIDDDDDLEEVSNHLTIKQPEETTEIETSLTASAPDSRRVFVAGSQQQLPNARQLDVQQKQNEFANNIRGKNFFNAMAMIVGELSHLEIMTIVEDEDDPYFEGDLSNYQGLPGQRMITRIGMIDGDIQNFIGSRFIESPNYQDLRTFHQEQVEQGHQIVNNNLEALKNAINYLKDLKNQD